ncbi:MAG: Tn3 family transposase [Solimicrobium sp.]|jgi:hypothetical protein|nr:Tn3 family transposase [Solimicrobium sp.]
MTKISKLSKPTRLEQQQTILKLFSYRICNNSIRPELEKKAQRLAILSSQPMFIFREIMQYLENERLVAPGYTYLQDMVGSVVGGERRRITHFLSKGLTSEIEKQLESLIQADDAMYSISVFKHEPRDFSYGELRKEVAKRKFFQPLYVFGQTFLASAGISSENIKYYASLVQFYTVFSSVA